MTASVGSICTRITFSISGTNALGPRFELKVPLETLKPEPDRMWARPAGFWSGVSMLVICGSIPLGFETALPSYWKGLAWTLAIGGALLAIATCRRVEWAIFRNAVGTEAVTIARAGKNRDGFQAFVAAVNAAVISKRESIKS